MSKFLHNGGTAQSGLATSKGLINALAFAVLMLLCNINVVKAQNVCSIGEGQDTKYYSSLSSAIAEVENGQTINILVSEIAMPLIHNTAKSFTIQGLSSRGNGTTVTSWNCGTNGEDKAKLNEITFQNLNVTPSISFYGNNTVFNNVEFTEGVFYGYIGSQASEDNGPVTFNYCKLLATSQQYGLHFDELHDDLIVNNCEIKGTVALSQPTNPNYTINFTGCDFTGRGGGSHKCNINFYSSATLTDCTFTDDYCNGSGRGILTVNPNTLVELNNCSLANEQSEYNLTDFIRRDYVSCAAFDATKNGDNKFTAGTFIANTQNELNMFCDESIKVDWLGNSTVFTYDAEDKTVNIEGNVDGTVKVPMDADLTIADGATFAEGSRVYLPTGRSSEYYKEWVENNVPASAAETVTVKGWCFAIGNNGYYTLADAAKEVADGQTIKLLDNIDEAEAVATTSGISFTIDMNGFNYANAEAIANNSTNITLIDNNETAEGLSFSAQSYTGNINVGEANKTIVLTTNGFTQTTGGKLKAYGDVTMTGFNLGNVQLGFETGTATSDKMTFKGPDASIQTAYIGQADMDDALNIGGWLDRSYTLDIVGEQGVTENISCHSIYLRTTGTVNVTDANFNIGHYVLAYGALNFTRSTVTFGGYNFYISGRPSKMADGKAIVTLDNSTMTIPCAVEIGGGTLGQYGSGLLSITNNSTLEVHKLYMDAKNANVNNAIKTVVDNSKFKVQNNNNGTVTMKTGTELEIIAGENSEMLVDKLTNDGGTIWVDMTNATAPIYKLIDAVTASYGEAGTGYKFVTDKDNGYTLTVAGNDLLASKSSLIDMDTLLVDASYTSYNYGEEIEGREGFYYGFNAFSTLHDAASNISDLTSDVQVLSTSTDESGVQIFFDVNHNVTLEGNISLTNPNGWSPMFGNTEGTTFTIDNDITTNSVVAFGVNKDFKQAPCNVLINGNVTGSQVWTGRNAKVTVSKTGSISAAGESWIQRGNTVFTINGDENAQVKQRQFHANYSHGMYGGELNLNNTRGEIGNSYFNLCDYSGESEYSMSVNLNNSELAINGDMSITKTAAKGSVSLTNGSTLTAANINLSNENAELNISGGCTVTATSITNNGEITIDMTGLTGESYTIIDYTGTGSMTLADYGKVTVTGGDYLACVSGNDLCVTTAICKIGSKQYHTLAEAYNDVSTGETITLIANVKESLTNEKNFTLDLNGKTLSSDGGTVITNNGTLTLTDGVGGSNITGGECGVKQSGTLTLSGNVNITGNTKNLYMPDGKKFSISDPSDGMNVGISTEADPTEGDDIELTDGNDEDYSSYFFSDNAYPIRNNAGNILVITHDVKITLTTDMIDGGQIFVNGEEEPVVEPFYVTRGTEITITAKQNDGWAFNGWFNKKTGEMHKTPTWTLTADQNLELEVRFTDKVIWIKVKK